MGKLGQPDEIADFIVYLLSDRSGVVTGRLIDGADNTVDFDLQCPTPGESNVGDLKTCGARIDIWGIGTKLVTAYDQPALGGVYKLGAIRTPGGKREGKLKNWHPAALAAHVLKAIAERNKLDPSQVDDVVMGCVMQVGPQSLNIARNAVLAAGWPESVPGTTVDRQCGSSQQAAHFAAQGVIAGAYDVVVAGGVEVMTRVPMGSSMADGKYGYPFGPRIGARYAEQGAGATILFKDFSVENTDRNIVCSWSMMSRN